MTLAAEVAGECGTDTGTCSSDDDGLHGERNSIGNGSHLRFTGSQSLQPQEKSAGQEREEEIESVILSGAKDLQLRNGRSFAVSAAQDDVRTEAPLTTDTCAATDSRRP